MHRFRIALGAEGAHTAGVADLLRRAGWEATGGLDWNVYWDIQPPDEGVYRSAAGGRRLNMLWGSGALTVKSQLHRQIARTRQRLAIVGREDVVDIEPRTFVMPEDHAAWREAAAWEPDTWWIRKPEASSRGRGITLVDALDDVTPEAGWIVQEYVRAPHLLDGYKYTLRLYVLLTSVDPCVAWLHADGFAKLASRPFRRDLEGRRDRFANLTNPDILREDPTAPVSSRNLTLEAYRARLRGDGVDVQRLWARIRRVAAAAVLAGREPMLRQAEAHGVRTEGAFELIGLDVTLDEQLRPLLLECNAAPSLAVEADARTAASRDEAAVKRRVIGDTLVVAGIVDGSEAPRFAPLVPGGDTADLLACADVWRVSDVASLRDRLRLDGGWQPLAPLGAVHEPMGDRLMLFALRTEEFLPLSAAGSVMWLGLASGLSPDAIADEMGAAMPDGAQIDRGALADDVWLAMCNWVWTGLLAPVRVAPASARTPRTATAPVPINEWQDDPVVALFGCRCVVRGSQGVIEAIRPALAGIEALDPRGAIDGGVEVMRAGEQFVVAADGRELRCGPLEVAATIVRAAARIACRANRALMAGRAVVYRRVNGAAIVLASDEPREPILVRVSPDDHLELKTRTGEVLPLTEIVLPGSGLERSDVAPDAGFLEWMASDPTRVLALEEESAGRFMRAAAGLTYRRRPVTSTAPAARGTR